MAIAGRAASGHGPDMTKAVLASVTLNLDAARRNALDVIAQATHRDREAVLTEAIDAYLDVQRWQVGHITEGLRQAEVGEFASDEEVAAAFARWC